MFSLVNKCQLCSSEFTAKSRLRRYCFSCTPKVREKALAISKQQTKNCATCGAEFTGRPTKKFCSRPCSIKHHSAAQSVERKVAREGGASYLHGTKVCRVCSKPVGNRGGSSVTCSPECSAVIARKAKVKSCRCGNCGVDFHHTVTGVPTRCPDCRVVKVTKPSEAPCAYCGNHYRLAVGEYSRFCSRSCSSKGINAEGLANSFSPEQRTEITNVMVSFIKASRHAPSFEEIRRHAGVSENFVNVSLGLYVKDLFALAGRNNKSLFPSVFEERVYYALLDCGIPDADIVRQKTYPGLYSRSKRWPLRFDFYVSSLDLLVEADGDQHYMDTHHMFNVEATKASDLLKNAYAKQHGIKIVRIRYSPFFEKVFETVSQQLAPLLGNGQMKTCLIQGTPDGAILSEAGPRGLERATTIPRGSRIKRSEMAGIPVTGS